MSGIYTVLFFLISLLFSLVIYSLLLRCGFAYLRVSSLNQVYKLIATVTRPIVFPLNFLFPHKEQPRKKYDFPAFIALMLAELIKITILSLIFYRTTLPAPYVPVYVFADLVINTCNVLFYTVLIRAILSFTNPDFRHPLNEILFIITEPLLRLGRKIIPNISGFDFAPVVVMVILKIITLFIYAYLPWDLI